MHLLDLCIVGFCHPKQLLGGSSDTAIEEMYEDPDLTIKDIPVAKITSHLTFLQKMMSRIVKVSLYRTYTT